MLWLLLLTFSCSVEPVNFNSTCSLLWLFVPCILLLLCRLLQLSACDSGCGPSATGGAVWTGQSGHLASVSGWNAPWPWPWPGTPLWGLEGGGCGGGGGWRLSRCSAREREEIMLMSRPRHPLWLGGTWTPRDTESLWVCLSRGHHARSESHCEPLLIKWLSVHPMVSQRYTTTKPVPSHKKTPVKRYQPAIETATLPLCLSLLLPATVNKYGTWYQRCSIPSPFSSPLLVERSPLHTKQSITDSLISNYAL